MKRLLSALALAALAPVFAADDATVQPLLAKNGCQGCHAHDTQVTGPSWHDIAARYINKPDARTYLAGKIRNGSANTWVAAAMPPNPQVDDLDMKLIVDWLATGALVPVATPAPVAAPAPAPPPASVPAPAAVPAPASSPSSVATPASVPAQ